MNVAFGFAILGGVLFLASGFGLISTLLSSLKIMYRRIWPEGDDEENMERLRDVYPKLARRTMLLMISWIFSIVCFLFGSWFGLYVVIVSHGHKAQIAADHAFGPLWAMIGIAAMMTLAALVAVMTIRDGISCPGLVYRIPKSFRNDDI